MMAKKVPPLTKEQFKERLEQLQEVIMSALSFYAVWNKLRLHDASEVSWSLARQDQLLGRWNGFFTPVGIGLQRIALVEIAKVFDDDRRTVSLTNLLKEARRDKSLVPHAGPTDLADIANKLRQARATIRPLKTLRNQRLAHADATPDQLPPLMTQAIDSLVEDIKNAFNRLSSAHGRSVWAWDFALDTSARQTSEVLGVLLKEMARKEIKYDDQMVDIAMNHIRSKETTLGRFLNDDELQSVAREFVLTPEQVERVRQARGA